MVPLNLNTILYKKGFYKKKSKENNIILRNNDNTINTTEKIPFKREKLELKTLNGNIWAPN